MWVYSGNTKNDINHQNNYEYTHMTEAIIQNRNKTN